MTDFRAIGTIETRHGRFELRMATKPAPRSQIQLERGAPEQWAVWLFQFNSYTDSTAWSSSLDRALAKPDPASGIIGQEGSVELRKLLLVAAGQ